MTLYGAVDTYLGDFSDGLHGRAVWWSQTQIAGLRVEGVERGLMQGYVQLVHVCVCVGGGG